MASGGFSDHFSSVSSGYARHRPHYPRELFVWLATLAPGHRKAWDCGTGNGQAAVSLAEFFDTVVATDASAAQIGNAMAHERVHYRVAAAECPQIEANAVDLITVAQALHWFDRPRFYDVSRQVLTNDGVLAAWCYGLLQTVPDVAAIIDTLYHGTLARYWPAERRYIDTAYQSIGFPYERIPAPHFEMYAEWRRDDLSGYLRTWSAVQRCTQDTGRNPVDAIDAALDEAWGASDRMHPVVWPIHVVAGRVPPRD